MDNSKLFCKIIRRISGQSAFGFFAGNSPLSVSAIPHEVLGEIQRQPCQSEMQKKPDNYF